MKKIRVLIVDDSVIIRKLLSDILSSDPDIEVVATAPNGRIALARIPQINPDLITLDIEMPEMDGLETLAELRKDNPKLPVIMFSTLTERGASATLDALALGANDYVAKPSNSAGGAKAAHERVREELIPKIKTFCRHVLGLETRKTNRRQAPSPQLSKKAITATGKPAKVEILAVGTSTGGPNALTDFFAALPGDLPVPIVIVQHMPPIFTRLLAERLSAKSELTVVEAGAGDVLEPGKAWIAPGAYHMALKKDGMKTVIDINEEPPENSCRPSVDVLFRSVAELYGENALAVIMTGMGQDGLNGCQEIHRRGGRIVVQDEASSVVWGMPGVVAEEGLADDILPLDEIGRRTVERIRRNRLSEYRSQGKALTG